MNVLIFGIAIRLAMVGVAANAELLGVRLRNMACGTKSKSGEEILG
jgi:hypothetical protein